MYYAEDMQYKWFQRKLERLDEIMRDERITTTQLLSKVDPQLGELFRKFSKWLHSSSYFKRIVEWVLSGRQRPSYTIGAPIPYIDDDIGLLNELEKDIRSVRQVIRKQLNKWYSKVGI